MSNSSLINQNVSKIVEILHEHDSFAVISHTSPDGDTLGSAAALCYALRQLNKKCVLLCDGKPSDALKDISELNEFISEDQTIADYDAFIAVDCADLKRLGKWAGAYNSSDIKVVIDHHITNCGFGDVNYIENYPACAQLVFNIIDALGIGLNKEIATCLYVAFLTDTGRFSYRGVNEITMNYVARLYGCGLDFEHINRIIFSQRTFEKSKLLAKALDNLRLWLDGRVSVIFIGYDDYSRLVGEGCDTEGIVNYALDVKGCYAAVFAYEFEPGKTKVSFRSVSTKYNVSLIASSFGGGGHIQAAGCTQYTDVKDAEELLFKAFSEHFVGK